MLKIYGVPVSVHTRKVLIVAALKGLAHEVIPVVPVIPGNPPSLINVPSGCSFHPRCPHAERKLCDAAIPQIEEVSANHLVRCHRWRAIAGARL